jgi:hypothetical protein
MMKLREALFGDGDQRSEELEAALAHRQSSVAIRRHAVGEARQALQEHACGRNAGTDAEAAHPVGIGREER